MASLIASLIRSSFSAISRPLATAPPCRTAETFPTLPACTGLRTGSLGEMYLSSWYGRISTSGLSLSAHPADIATGDDAEEPVASMRGASTPSRLDDVALPYSKARQLIPASSTQEREPELLLSTWATEHGYFQAAHHAAARAHASLIRCSDDTSVVPDPAMPCRTGPKCEEYDRSEVVEGRPLGPYDVQIPLTQTSDGHQVILRLAAEPPYTRRPYSLSTGDWASRTVRDLPFIFRTVCIPRVARCCSDSDSDDDDDDDDDDDTDTDGGDPGFEVPLTAEIDGFYDGMIFQMDL